LDTVWDAVGAVAPFQVPIELSEVLAGFAPPDLAAAIIGCPVCLVEAHVLANLLDLLPITKNAIALPLPSYSLKVVEGYVGFRRKQQGCSGDWAMAQFIRATETGDEAERNARMGEILRYNEEDLAATWAVFGWLRGKAANRLAVS
jgi:predicted RecB family nuclease